MTSSYSVKPTLLEQSIKTIQSGELLIYPTEGVYGIGCDPHNRQAIEKLINLKQRDPSKGIILIASDFSMLESFISPLSDEILQRINTTWPGPVSWIVPAATDCPRLLTGGRDTIAVRVSAHPFVQQLCNALGHAITSTSANISGHTPLENTTKLKQVFGSSVATIVNLPLGQLQGSTPIFDALTGKQLR